MSCMMFGGTRDQQGGKPRCSAVRSNQASRSGDDTGPRYDQNISSSDKSVLLESDKGAACAEADSTVGGTLDAVASGSSRAPTPTLVTLDTASVTPVVAHRILVNDDVLTSDCQGHTRTCDASSAPMLRTDGVKEPAKARCCDDAQFTGIDTADMNGMTRSDAFGPELTPVQGAPQPGVAQGRPPPGRQQDAMSQTYAAEASSQDKAVQATLPPPQEAAGELKLGLVDHASAPGFASVDYQASMVQGLLGDLQSDMKELSKVVQELITARKLQVTEEVGEVIAPVTQYMDPAEWANDRLKARPCKAGLKHAVFLALQEVVWTASGAAPSAHVHNHSKGADGSTPCEQLRHQLQQLVPPFQLRAVALLTAGQHRAIADSTGHRGGVNSTRMVLDSLLEAQQHVSANWLHLLQQARQQPRRPAAAELQPLLQNLPDIAVGLLAVMGLPSLTEYKKAVQAMESLLLSAVQVRLGAEAANPAYRLSVTAGTGSHLHPNEFGGVDSAAWEYKGNPRLFKHLARPAVRVIVCDRPGVVFEQELLLVPGRVVLPEAFEMAMWH